jgi:hypothetical protein
MKKNLSIICVFFFLLIALSSTRTIRGGSFYIVQNAEESDDARNYLLKNNGEKVYGDKITWQGGAFVKDKINIDDQEFKTSDIRGYKLWGFYFGRLGKNMYVQRIVHGRINIYCQKQDNIDKVEYYAPGQSGFYKNRESATVFFYSQLGDSSELKLIRRKNNIEKLVQGCQTSIDMINKKNKEIRRAQAEDPQYYNRIIEIYNNGCKIPEKTE